MCDFFLLTDDSGVDIVVFWSGRSTPIYIYIYIYCWLEGSVQLRGSVTEFSLDFLGIRANSEQVLLDAFHAAISNKMQQQ
jgi:hypothetical protein